MRLFVFYLSESTNTKKTNTTPSTHMQAIVPRAQAYWEERTHGLEQECPLPITVTTVSPHELLVFSSFGALHQQTASPGHPCSTLYTRPNQVSAPIGHPLDGFQDTRSLCRRPPYKMACVHKSFSQKFSRFGTSCTIIVSRQKRTHNRAAHAWK